MSILHAATRFVAHNHFLITLAHATAHDQQTLFYMSLAYLVYAVAETAIIVLAIANGLIFQIGRAVFRLIVILAIYSIACFYLLEYLDHTFVT